MADNATYPSRPARSVLSAGFAALGCALVGIACWWSARTLRFVADRERNLGEQIKEHAQTLQLAADRAINQVEQFEELVRGTAPLSPIGHYHSRIR